ncbi:hypothetical protein ENSA7_14910 [Enhygromyxa salina]|uniref:Preprotein translocase subunit SecA n=1 Tax=Enhygromyxa salina TaxID=215803 RepID=A0A2S9YUS8_9BACT|nr:hypothetical protein ENSA7_14910 [Enhygromyxa salina]
MQHDEHFLSRLERLDGGHAELALGLYYDSALVEHVLSVADIPADADRVALALGGPEDDGPYVIVARNGHFVTCLGQGMQVQDGQPIVTRHRLDTISESVESLRALISEAKAGGKGQIERALERTLRTGRHLNQQEFEALARWLPLLSIHLFVALIDAVQKCHQLYEHLCLHKKYSRRHHEALHEFWRSAWAVAHLTLSLGSDGGATLRGLIDRLEPELPGAGLQLPWGLIRLGVTSFAARGAWVASKLPTHVLPAAKRRYASGEGTFFSSMTDASSLIAIGLRHRRYQAEVRKALAKVGPPSDRRPTVVESISGLAAGSFDHLCANPEMFIDNAVESGRALLRQLYSDRDQAVLDSLDLDEVPGDVAVALFLTLPFKIFGMTQAVTGLFERIPWVVGVEARSFYLPEQYAAFGRASWTPDESITMIEARKGDIAVSRPPVVKGPKIGRNAPCPCGSGNKYKRCCGGPGASGHSK